MDSDPLFSVAFVTSTREKGSCLRLRLFGDGRGRLGPGPESLDWRVPALWHAGQLTVNGCVLLTDPPPFVTVTGPVVKLPLVA